MGSTSAKWFYLIGGQPHGPVDPAELKRLATSGHLKPTDKIRREDMTEWYFAKDMTGLFTAQSQAASKPAPKADGPSGDNVSWASFGVTGLKIAGALFWWLLLARVWLHGEYYTGRAMLAYTICFAVARYNPCSFRTWEAYAVLVLGLLPAWLLLFFGSIDYTYITTIAGFVRVSIGEVGEVAIVWLICKGLFGRKVNMPVR